MRQKRSHAATLAFTAVLVFAGYAVGARQLKEGSLLAADGLDMLTELVGEGSQAAKSSWQDTAAAAGRLYDQLDQALSGKEQHLASTAGQALEKITQTLLNTPQREGNQLQAALAPSASAVSGAAQQAATKWGDTLRQYLQKQAAPPALSGEGPAPAPTTASVVGVDGQPVPGVTTTTVPALTVPTSAVPALTNGAVKIIDPSDPAYEQYAQQAAGGTTTDSSSTTTSTTTSTAPDAAFKSSTDDSAASGPTITTVDPSDPMYSQYLQQAAAAAASPAPGSEVAGVTVIDPSANASPTSGTPAAAAAPSAEPSTASSSQQDGTAAAAAAAAPRVQVINPGDAAYEQYAEMARNSNSMQSAAPAPAAASPLTPVSAGVVAFDRVDFTPRLAPNLRDNSAERRRKYTAAAAGTIATAAASHIAKSRAAAAVEPQVGAASGPLIKHVLRNKKEAAAVPALAAAVGAQPVVVMPQPATAAIPTTTTGGIALHTGTPVTVSAPINVSTPVEQKSVQLGSGKGKGH